MKLIFSKRTFSVTIVITTLIVLTIHGMGFAAGEVASGNENSISNESHSLVGDNLKNNTVALKILKNIETYKKLIAQLQQNSDQNSIVDQQRNIVNQLTQQALQTLETENTQNTPKVAYERFASTVNNTNAQNIFWGEFDFMAQKVEEGNNAMKGILENGGTWEQAIQEFDNHAAITHDQLVEINKNLNIKYGFANPQVQDLFDKNGIVPADFVHVDNNGIQLINSSDSIGADNGQAGYQDVAIDSSANTNFAANTAINGSDNNSSNNSQESTYAASSGSNTPQISIVSIQPTDEHGNPVTSFSRGTVGFAKVVSSADSNQITLVPVDLFDSNNDSFHVGSIKAPLGVGQSEMIVSFYVPKDAVVGSANIYANAFSDWPSNGGTPLTGEVSASVEIQ